MSDADRVKGAVRALGSPMDRVPGLTHFDGYPPALSRAGIVVEARTSNAYRLRHLFHLSHTVSDTFFQPSGWVESVRRRMWGRDAVCGDERGMARVSLRARGRSPSGVCSRSDPASGGVRPPVLGHGKMTLTGKTPCRGRAKRASRQWRRGVPYRSSAGDAHRLATPNTHARPDRWAEP